MSAAPHLTEAEEGSRCADTITTANSQLLTHSTEASTVLLVPPSSNLQNYSTKYPFADGFDPTRLGFFNGRGKTLK